MKTARLTLLIPVLVTLPFAAYADGFIDPLPADYPIPASSLVIDYEGTVFEVSDGVADYADYAVGDGIAGRLVVDLSAGVDSRSAPNRRSYLSSSDPSGFVRGFWIPGGDGEDGVFIANDLLREGDDRPVDIFSVSDEYIVTGGSGDGAMVFSLNATLYDFLDSVDIDQSFEVTAADFDQPQEDLSGFIRFSSIGPFPLVKFALERLTVKPGRCFAT
jgi:hypothetical protein